MVNPVNVRWAAEQVYRQHRQEPAQDIDGRPVSDQWRYPPQVAGRCAHCTGEGECRMLAWAEAELADLRGVS